MEKIEAILDGKKIDVVVKLDPEDIELYETKDYLEDTINLTEELEKTQVILGDINEPSSTN